MYLVPPRLFPRSTHLVKPIKGYQTSTLNYGMIKDFPQIFQLNSWVHFTPEFWVRSPCKGWKPEVLSCFSISNFKNPSFNLKVIAIQAILHHKSIQIKIICGLLLMFYAEKQVSVASKMPKIWVWWWQFSSREKEISYLSLRIRVNLRSSLIKETKMNQLTGEQSMDWIC